MKKMCFGIALVVLYAGSFSSCAHKHGGESDFVIEALSGGESAVITGYTGTKKDVRIPVQIQGLTVTAIGETAFREKGITSVTIPGSVTEVGSLAFYLNPLSTVTIPGSVTKIGSRAFAGNQLTSITIPASVSVIEGGAFTGNPLSNVSVDAGNAMYISKNSFLMSRDERQFILYYGSGNTVIIPESVAVIRMGALAHKGLAGVTIPDGVTDIEASVFAYNQLVDVTIPGSVTKIGERAFLDNQLGSIVIGANVVIAESAFGNDFVGFYNAQGRMAGAYTFSDGQWSVDLSR